MKVAAEKTANTEQTTATDDAAKTKTAQFTESFLRDAESKISDLGTSDKEIMDIVIRGTTADETNPGLLAGLQQLIDTRTRNAGVLTNFITKIGNTAEEIIRNYRN